MTELRKAAEKAMILKEIAALKEEIECEERRFNQLWDQFAALDKANQELVEALKYHQEQTRPIQRTIDLLAKHKEQE